ncbi:DUF805 domain-containing protein [Stakelama tenebrarum]|uniref:DUF805 domain-containing protein n=1 Tax=Stakelama tenebrarum TaxID=2711215 RepID=A0A6G6Y9S3_9SPHN|nr:DUF805 domain-containing protein [Sphingosinithalassobacter tenebrarum]QIG81323.1 DUF805 domain-containing protein [Sphingosinithalassobacter tenebrarum]
MAGEGYRKPSLGHLGLKAYRDTFRFHGRSTRSEVVGFWIVSMLLGILLLVGIWIAAAFGIELNEHTVLDSARYLLYLPLVALLVRRLRDADRSPLWLLLYPAAGLSIIAASLLPQGDGFTLSFFTITARPAEGWGYLLAISSSVCMVLLLVLIFLPGTTGPNRHGPDPRSDEDSTSGTSHALPTGADPSPAE